MVPVYPDKLSAHVAASNLVNTIRNDMARPVYEAWSNMLGKKVIKADGAITVTTHNIKFAIDHEKYGLRQGDCHMFLDCRSSSYSLRYVLWVDVHYSYLSLVWGKQKAEERQSHIRSEATLRIGEIKNQVLTNIETAPMLRTDYNVETVLEARKELKALQEVEREIKPRIGHFGEY